MRFLRRGFAALLVATVSAFMFFGIASAAFGAPVLIGAGAVGASEVHVMFSTLLNPEIPVVLGQLSITPPLIVHGAMIDGNQVILTTEPLAGVWYTLAVAPGFVYDYAMNPNVEGSAEFFGSSGPFTITATAGTGIDHSAGSDRRALGREPDL